MATTAFSDEQLIRTPAPTVWHGLTDWSRASEWMPGVTSMTPEGPLAVGTELAFTARGKSRRSRIAELDEGREITLTSTAPGVEASYRYRLEPVGEEATRVSLVADVTTKGPMKLLGGTIRSAIAKEDGVQLVRLKSMLEGA